MSTCVWIVDWFPGVRWGTCQRVCGLLIGFLVCAGEHVDVCVDC